MIALYSLQGQRLDFNFCSIENSFWHVLETIIRQIFMRAQVYDIHRINVDENLKRLLIFCLQQYRLIGIVARIFESVCASY